MWNGASLHLREMLSLLNSGDKAQRTGMPEVFAAQMPDIELQDLAFALLDLGFVLVLLSYALILLLWKKCVYFVPL